MTSKLFLLLSNNSSPLLFYIVATLAFTFNFKANLFSSAADSFFDWFQQDGESLVVGRLLLSEKNGLTDHAAFLGWTHPTPDTNDMYVFQYDAYKQRLDFDRFEGYYSQPGMQAFIDGLICKITGWSGFQVLDMLQRMTSFCTALAFVAYLVWVITSFWWTTAVFTFVCLLFSQWVTVFGRNLFWTLSAFYIPFLVALFWLQRGETKSKHPLLVTFLLMFASVFVKFLLTGFEYITTVCVMAVVPWVFYAIDRQWDVRKIVRSAAAACGGVATAVCAGIGWLAVQLSFELGSLREGMHYIIWSFGKRAHGLASETYDKVYQDSINSSQWEVLSRYLNDHAFHFAHWFDSPALKSLGIVYFGNCILFFVLVGIIALSMEKIRKNREVYRRLIALTATLWTSLLAPLSWFVIFKGHSYIHPHMNPIVWYMPFMLFGFVLTGNLLKQLRIKNNESPTIANDK
jgi:hypothetical protein